MMMAFNSAQTNSFGAFTKTKLGHHRSSHRVNRPSQHETMKLEPSDNLEAFSSGRSFSFII